MAKLKKKLTWTTITDICQLCTSQILTHCFLFFQQDIFDVLDMSRRKEKSYKIIYDIIYQSTEGNGDFAERQKF